MSTYEINTGKLEATGLSGEVLEELAEMIYLGNRGQQKSPYDSYTEWLIMDKHDGNAFLVGGELYVIKDHKRTYDLDDLCTLDKEGNFLTYHYNGGGSFTELLEQKISNSPMKPDTFKISVVNSNDGYSAIYFGNNLHDSGNPLGDGNSFLYLLELSEKYGFTSKDVTIYREGEVTIDPMNGRISEVKLVDDFPNYLSECFDSTITKENVVRFMGLMSKSLIEKL